MKKALIFDCYGTLISTGNGSIEAVKKILHNKDCDASPQQFYAQWKAAQKRLILSLEHFVTEEEVFRRTLKQLYIAYGLPGDANEDVEIMLDTLGKRAAFAETTETLDDLRGKYRLMIGSTTDDKPFYDDVRRNQIRVDDIYTSESLGVYKPLPKFYQSILQKSGLQPEHVLFIGDSQEDDVQGPQAVGIETVWVNRNKARLLPHIPQPTYEITDLSGLRAFL